MLSDDTGHVDHIGKDYTPHPGLSRVELTHNFGHRRQVFKDTITAGEMRQSNINPHSVQIKQNAILCNWLEGGLGVNIIFTRVIIPEVTF
ncbi:MAG: hypothetical protein DDT32_00948 [Syntrophomonadaceae bacterium]|nr:hypothetical protein [Bacillota bacterium]MBT9147196.1 hypothetical protein [Bacillota bacterium]